MFCPALIVALDFGWPNQRCEREKDAGHKPDKATGKKLN